jgi:hypothetical protein
LFSVGARAEMPVGCALIVSDLLANGHRQRIEEEQLVLAAESMGRAAITALAL